MKTTAIKIEGKVDELLVVLDEDIENIQKNLSRLNELRSLIIKHDDAALSKLLESIQAESDSNLCHELKRQSIRRELANALGYDIEQMTLSTLETDLPKEKQEQVTRRKAKLTSLIEELKKEHLSTVLLLSDCARFNRSLLKSVFNLGNTGTVYYGSNGASKKQPDTAFVNLQF
jgi:sugar-specific transcriptional regulator TrmB